MIADRESQPSTGSKLADELDTSIRVTRWAQAIWASAPLRSRLRVFRRLRAALSSQGIAVAKLSADLRHRPVEEVITSELMPLLEACRFLERHAASILAPRRLGSWGRPLWLGGVRSRVGREPLGVVLIIGPANYPLLLPGIQMLQALAAGNAVWIKPAPSSSAPLVRLVALLVASGLDPALVKILPESVEAARAAMSMGVDKVLFTGSSAAGREVLRFLAPRAIPATLELSGVDPVLIRPDADLDLVANALAFGLRLNAGQTCMAPRRVFLPPSLLSSLETRLATRLETVPVTVFSPSMTGVLQPLLQDSLDSGARWIAGGSDRGPAVLSGVPPGSRILRSEWMVPLLVLVPVTNEDEAVRCANDCAYGLGASVFTRNETEGWELAHRIQGGVVSINDLIIPTGDARLPFGGRRSSGYGVTRGPEGLLDLTVPKVITCSSARFRPAFRPHQPGDAALFSGYLRCTHGGGFFERCVGLMEMLRALVRRNGSDSTL